MGAIHRGKELKKQEKVYGQGDDFSFVHAGFEMPRRHSYYVQRQLDI